MKYRHHGLGAHQTEEQNVMKKEVAGSGKWHHVTLTRLWLLKAKYDSMLPKGGGEWAGGRSPGRVTVFSLLQGRACLCNRDNSRNAAPSPQGPCRPARGTSLASVFRARAEVIVVKAKSQR